MESAEYMDLGVWKWARRISGVALILTFVVILAGSVVRMTGSGMGCPDWPKCFGLMIPPTSLEEVMFDEHMSYSSGMMVIKNDTLWVANSEVGTGVWNRSQWNKYPHHDYARETGYHSIRSLLTDNNPKQTWWYEDSNTNKHYLKLPEDTNTWWYNDAKVKHATDFYIGHKKQLIMYQGTIKESLKYILADSMQKYSDYVIYV